MAVPPNGPIEVVFSLDTTGSMSSVLDEIRLRLQDMITRLQADIPGIKFAIVAHGDYCDATHFYVTKHVDFTDDLPTLCNFMNDVSGTGGGDISECYELVLRLAREKLSWTPSSQQILIMVGDAYPHEPDYPLNTDKIDWRDEIQIYSDSGVHIYGVHVFEDPESENFFKTISQKTFGEYIKMTDFNHVCDIIMAICYRERDADFLQGYEAEVRSRFGFNKMDHGLEGVFGVLKRGDSRASNSSNCSFPVTPLPPLISPLSTMETIPPTSVTPIPGKTSRKAKCRLSAKKDPKKPVMFPKAHKSSNKTTGSRKLQREKVTVNNFAYNNFNWTRWRLAVQQSPSDGTKMSSRKWKKVDGFLICKYLFPSGRRTQPSFYEVAVQTKPGHKRHVVYFDLRNLSVDPGDWFKIFFDSTTSQKQIKSVIKNGCRLFIRKADIYRRIRKPMTYDGFLEGISQKYDYSWCGQEPREVYVPKHDIYIS